MLQMNGELIRQLIQKRFAGRIALLQDAWSERFVDPDDPESKVPNRTTFDRWRKGKCPRTKEDVLRLAGLLDVDPIAAFHLPEGRLVNVVQQLSSRYLFGLLNSGPLSFVDDLFRAQQAWPPNDLVKPYFLRDWSVAELTHDPSVRANYNATIELLDDNWDPPSPRVYHFAYRRNLREVKAWIPYGVVIRSPVDVKLIHSSGYTRELPIDDASGTTPVGTWFGEGPALFRIASLHIFTATVGDDRHEDEIVSFLA